MIVCTSCGSADWEMTHKSVIDPAEDTFRCRECGHVFLRYDKTADNAKRYHPGQPGCNAYGEQCPPENY